MLSLSEEDFILQLSGLEPGEGSRLFWEEAKHVASRPFQPTYDDELFYEAECSGAELIELRKTAYVKLNLDIMRQYATQAEFVAGLRVSMTVSNKAMEKAEIPEDHALWVEEIRLIMQWRREAGPLDGPVVALQPGELVELLGKMESIAALRKETAAALLLVTQMEAAAAATVAVLPVVERSPAREIPARRWAGLDAQTASLQLQLQTAKNRLGGEHVPAPAGGGAAHGLTPPAPPFFNTVTVIHEPYWPPGANPLPNDGHKTIRDADGRKFRVLQLVHAVENIRTTYFLRRVYAKAFLDICLTLEGDGILLDITRATRVFTQMSLGGGALGRNPIQPFDWCPTVHAARELRQLAIIRTPLLFERWMKGTLCELRYFTISGAVIENQQWNRLLESLRNFQKLLDLFGPHFSTPTPVLIPLLEVVEDRDVQLRAPLNWVISLCQGRISEFLDIMRVPTYLEHVKATEGYPPDLASNEHAAQLLTACLQGMKEQALDISLKEVWLNLHKGQVIPLQENGLAGANPTAAAPVAQPAAGGARAGRAAQPVVAPQVGHYGQPLGRPPRRRDTVEELRARNADLEARIHFLNHTDHGGGRNGNRTPTGGGMTGSPSGSYGGGRGSPAKRIRPGDARRDAEAACLSHYSRGQPAPLHGQPVICLRRYGQGLPQPPSAWRQPRQPVPSATRRWPGRQWHHTHPG